MGEVGAMVNDFANHYVILYQKLQRQQWENYFEEGQNDLTIIDNEIYKLVSFYRGKIKDPDRKSEIAKGLIAREYVDKNPRVSHLRNRLDDLKNYDADLPTQFKQSGSFYRTELARGMKRDVLDLMKLRNSLAVESGFNSYVDLVLASDQVDKQKLLILLNDYLDHNLPKVRWLIKKYGLTFESWFADLNRIGGEHTSHDPHLLINEVLEILGLAEIGTKMTVKIRNDGFTGYCTELSAHDIRLVIESVKSLDSLRTLFHELGHAVSYGLNGEEGLLRILPASQGESVAVVFEYIVSTICLGPNERRILNELMLLEYTRCAISALFEFDLWEEPEQASELYQKHYEKLGLVVNESDLWALDSFRSIDPVYIHNYVVGASIAGDLVNFLARSYADDYHLWGKWLRTNVYSEGNTRTFSSKVEAMDKWVLG